MTRRTDQNTTTTTTPPGTASPEGLPGFTDAQRFWERDTARWTVKLLPGECYVTRNDEAIVTVLGSCISACIRDPDTGLGGMNHFMLPERGPGISANPDSLSNQMNRYGCFAMESLINHLARHGAQRPRLELKVFGGGRILKPMIDIGARNIAFIHSWARTEGMRLTAQDLGGIQPRKLVYFPATGRARVMKLPPIENRSIADRELVYLEHLSEDPNESPVEIFK
jgi:chemotaxis protein CheD